ncbi:hypothetical protein HYC85_012244 [Camellia sinensis]|uniref:BFN domain-containing protein n=1 Tax=Camellia sinensis TaxID=4442 RepID=A0A7J7HDH4_CAMSI|nr:hypothetical protein HYC85_012244 [Camellia sinensis]
MASNNKKEEPNTAPQPNHWFNLILGSFFKDHYPSSKFCTLRCTSLGPAVEATSPPTSKVAKVQTLNKSIPHSMPNMSNLIGHNLIHHNLLALVVLEHQSKINSSCISGYNLFQVQANSQIRKSHITSKFWGKCLNLRKTKLPMGTNRVLSVFPQSVLAIDPTSKVVVSAPTSGSVSEIDMQVKSMLDPCEDENDDIQDDDMSLGADFVQRDEHSESVSEARPTMYQVVKEMVDKMGYAVKVVQVTKRVHEAYFAQLYLTKAYSCYKLLCNETKSVSFDLRPSDAINIAVICKVLLLILKIVTALVDF